MSAKSRLGGDRDPERRPRRGNDRQPSSSLRSRLGPTPGDRSRSRSPLGRTSSGRPRLSSRVGEVKLKDRLGDARTTFRVTNDRFRDNDAMDEDGGESTQRILDREELESQRPVVKPWDIDPEFVPRGRNYFEVEIYIWDI